MAFRLKTFGQTILHDTKINTKTSCNFAQINHVQLKLITYMHQKYSGKYSTKDIVLKSNFDDCRMKEEVPSSIQKLPRTTKRELIWKQDG